MIIEIDSNSGFCFGVVRAIREAEKALEGSHAVYSLGDIVHNKIEVQRLERMGLKTISKGQIDSINGQKLLVRAHGEPPSTYEKAGLANISIIDATCPVVARLQQLVKQAHQKMASVGGQVVVLGKRGHAEVVGLTGQVDDDVIVIENEADLVLVNFERPIYLLSQTTQSLALLESIAAQIRLRAKSRDDVTIVDTVCRQMANRESHLKEFAIRCDVVVFVCGLESSNGKVLFEVCRSANSKSYKIESSDELKLEWFEGAGLVGICGATSTPKWLMQQVCNDIEILTEI